MIYWFCLKALWLDCDFWMQEFIAPKVAQFVAFGQVINGIGYATFQTGNLQSVWALAPIYLSGWQVSLYH
jgi:hypothetical protein